LGLVEGFSPMPDRPEAERFAGPFYLRADAGRWQIGFRVKQRHLNRLGICHGGILATFADLQGHALKKNEGLQGDSPTITLSLDYVAPVQLGQWVEVEPTIVRRTPGLLFFQSLITADGQVALRASGIYKLRGSKQV